MKRLDTDLNGSNPENQFTERVEVSSEHPSQIYILDHSPFFKNITLTPARSTTPLQLGTDYELTYRVEELKGAVREDVYNGIRFLRPFDGTIIASGQAVGGGFYNPVIDAINALLKYVNEPLTTSYGNVIERPALVPPKPTYRPWFNITNKQYLASAVEDSADTVEASASAGENAIAALIERTQQLRQSMIALNVPGHINAKNPHNVNLTQLNAHPANLAAADTVLAYGYDVLELVRLIRAEGLKKADLDKYISRYGSDGVDGVFEFAEGKAKILSEDGLSSIQLDNGALQITTNGAVTLRAGYTKLSGKYLELKSGVNTLRIESSGNSLDDAKVTLNGKTFITTDNVFDYNPDDVDAQDELVNIKHSGVNLKITGLGSPSSPLSAEFDAPKATPTVAGTVRVGTPPASAPDNHAIASNTSIADRTRLVPETWRVADQPLSGNVTISKNTIGLSKVNNTADINKPLSDPLKQALALLSNKGHKHNAAEIIFDPATASETGVARIASNLSEFNALLAEAEHEWGEEEYVGDMPSRLFGVTNSFYEELRAAFYAAMPNIEDVLDTRELEVAATSGATFTVSGSVLTATGTHKFIAPTSESGKVGGVVGIIKGGVNLNNVSTEQWVSESSGIDYDFPFANVVEGKAIITDTNKQPKAGIKYRLNCEDGELNIVWSKNVPMVVYVNGERITALAAQGDIRREVPRGVSVVAFEFDTSSSTVAEAKIDISLVELDGTSTKLASTSEPTRFGYIPATAPFDNNRFFLYVNTSTGNVFATIGTYDYFTISKQFVYIGYVDTANGKVVGGPNLTFRGVIDYGMFTELSVHRADNDAHTSTTTEARGLENVEPHGMMTGDGVRGAPIYAVVVNSTSTVEEVNARDTALSVITRHSTVGNNAVELMSRVVGKTPLQFRSFNNALNPARRPVYEGCLQYYCNDVVRPDDANYRVSERIGLTFTRVLDDGNTRRLRVWLNRSEMQVSDYVSRDDSHVGILNMLAINNYPTTITKETFNYHGDLSGYLQTRQNTVSGSTRVSTVDFTGQIAYRYDPDTNTLKVYHRKQAFRTTTVTTTIIPPTVFGVTYDIEVLTIVPSVDISSYFPSNDVGLHFTADGSGRLGTLNLEAGMAATPFPIPSSVGDYRNFIDYDELFKTFLSADVVSEFSALNNGMRYGRFNANVNEVNKRFPGGTGFYGETAIGTAVTSCETTFPICMLPTRSNRYDQIVKYPLGISLRNWTEIQRIGTADFHRVGMSVLGTGGSYTGGTALEIPNKLTIYYDIDELLLAATNIYKVNRVQLTFKANAGIEVDCDVSYCGVGSVIPTPKVMAGYNDTYEVFLARFNVDTRPVVRRVAKFNLTMHNGVELQYGMWLSWRNDDGAIVNHPVNPVVGSTLELKPQTRGVVYYTPWHITSRTWEWYCAEGKNKS